MRAFRQTVWFTQGFIVKYKKLIFVSFSLTMLLLLFSFLVLPRLPKAKKSVYIGIVGKYTPTQIPPRIEKELGDGLVAVNEKMEPVPGLASKWEISNENKTYKFYLQEGLVWSNGEPVKLADISINIPDVELKKTEPNILEFTLPEVFSPFLTVLTKPIIKGGVLSIGKYSVKDVKTSGQYLSQVTLESSDGQIVFRFFDTVSQALLAFKLGKIDQLDGLVEKPEIANWPNVMVEEIDAEEQFVAVFYNNSDPILRDKSVRQALSYAIEDKEHGQLRSVSPISYKSWAYNENVKDYVYSVARAKELLSKALPTSDTGVVLELTTTPELLKLSEKIKEDWEKVGVTAEIRVVASRPTTFQVFVSPQTIPHDPDQYSLWHSTQDTNFVRYESKKVDLLLEEGRQTLNLEKRRQIYWDFQRFLAEDVPATFMYYPRVYNLVRK